MNFLFIKESLKKVSVSAEVLCSTTVFNIDNNQKLLLVSWAANQHIRMISEGSCDTEDYKLLLTRNYNKKQLFKIVIILYNITILLYFWLNKHSVAEQLYLYHLVERFYYNYYYYYMQILFKCILSYQCLYNKTLDFTIKITSHL